MDSFNNIDREKSNIDDNIRRVRSILGCGGSIADAVDALRVNGVCQDDIFLTVKAALVMDSLS
jgi:hypothetical protein